MIYEETCETRWKVLPQQFCWLVYEPSLHDTVDISQGLLKCGFLHPAMPFSWLVVSNSQTFYGNWDDMVFHGWTYGMDLLSNPGKGGWWETSLTWLEKHTHSAVMTVYFHGAKRTVRYFTYVFSGWTSIISYPKVVSNQAFPMVFPMLSGWLKTDGYLSSLGIHRSISTRIQPVTEAPSCEVLCPSWDPKSGLAKWLERWACRCRSAPRCLRCVPVLRSGHLKLYDGIFNGIVLYDNGIIILIWDDYWWITMWRLP